MRKHNLSTSVLVNGPQSQDDVTALRDATNDLASQAYAHLSRAKSLLLKRERDDNAISCFSAAIGTSVYLDHLSSCGFDPFVAAAQNSKLVIPFSWQLIKSRAMKTLP